MEMTVLFLFDEKGLPYEGGYKIENLQRLGLWRFYYLLTKSL